MARLRSGFTSAGVELGKTCPHPIIDHDAGRERTQHLAHVFARIERATSSALHICKSRYRYCGRKTFGG